jgi:Tol biopolymer transport system component
MVLDIEADVWPSSISTNGEMLLFDSGVFPSRDVGILALDTLETDMLAATDADEAVCSFSPDGRWFAFMSDETGQLEVYAQEVSSGRRFPVSTSTRGGAGPLWSKNGREIYYGPLGVGGIFAAEVDVESLRASEPIELSDIVRRARSGIDVTADGKRFLVTVPVSGGETEDTGFGSRLNVVLNWFEELKRRVPTGR